MKLIVILLTLLAIYLPSAYAVYLDSTVYVMPENKSFISMRIINNSQKSNIYTISAVGIDKPGRGGENSMPIKNGELLYAPLKLKINQDAQEFFKVFYRGSEDGKERYYRIVFRETPIVMTPYKDEGKETMIYPTIAMSTILIVRPRKLNFSYNLDEDNGILINNGNTFFKVIIQLGCQSNDDAATSFYILPGEKYINNKIGKGNKKFIVAFNKYIPLGSSCFDTQKH